jgi:hypothetical protein
VFPDPALVRLFVSHHRSFRCTDIVMYVDMDKNGIRRTPFGRTQCVELVSSVDTDVHLLEIQST